MKIQIGDIYYQRSLFPVYTKRIKHINLTEIKTGKPLLIAAETVIGKVGTTKFSVDKFDIDKMEFCFDVVLVNEKLSYTILSEIKYAGRKLNFNKADVLVNGFYVLLD